ncbi:hypothetical protein BGX34_001132 [Mortierella sp. NVP85]|nr:hypothetical protein BGX34_001132 [Mortierella sp. NVP85]
MYLLADFRILEPKPLLPSSLNTPHKQRLFLDFGAGREERLGPMAGGGVILQILDIQDIGVSSLKMLEACEALGVAGDQPGGFQVDKTLPKGMIALDVTDGIKKMRAMALEPIPGIAMEMKLGAKIRIKDVEVRHGVLQLNSSNTLLLGVGRASTSTTTTTVPAATAPYDTLTVSPNSSNNMQNNANTWRSLQQAVNAQDSIPLTRSSNQSEWQASNVDKNDSFQPTHGSKSGVRREDDQHFRQQGEQEAQWDYYDMDMDDFVLPDDDNWEAMSQLSADSGQQGKHIPNSKHNDTSWSMEIDSTVQGSPPARRKISLRSPQSHQKKQQDEESDARFLQAEDTQLAKRNSKGGLDGSKVARSSSRGAALDDFYDTGRPSSPRYDGAAQNKSLQKAVHMDSISRNPTEDSGYNDYLESTEDIHGSETLGKGVQRNKRRVSPEHESEEQDFLTNRRRSRSFPLAPLSQDTAVKTKVKVEKDDDQLVKVKVEETNGANSATSIMNEIPKNPLSQSRNFMPFAKSAGSDSSLVKIKTEAMNTRTPGPSDPPTVIDLLSDDDSCDERQTASKLDQGVSGIDILGKIKSEPSDSPIIQTKSTDYRTDTMAHIKQEETLLEFDMDDEDGFEGLLEAAQKTPEVELEQVAEAVRVGQEVRATARIHKLGKFVLTTLSVSIPIFLQPVAPSHTFTSMQQATDFTLEAVLDQSVVQQLMEYSHSQFKELIVHNAAEAKRAVAKLRRELSAVESAECHFRGLRADVPVVRVLNVLSRKRE